MATNDDVLSFMKDLERKFDSLEENVEGFKASRARAKTSTSRGTAPFNLPDSSEGALEEGEDTSGQVHRW